MDVKFLGEPVAGRAVTLMVGKDVFTTSTPAVVVERDPEDGFCRVTTESGDIYEGKLSAATYRSGIGKRADTPFVEEFEVYETEAKQWTKLDNKTSPKGKRTRLKGDSDKLKRPLVVPITGSLKKRAQVRETLENMWWSTYGPPQERTRHCPDHPGEMLMRVSDGVFQCGVDGKTYSYIDGFTTEKGKVVPGGSVSEQTPDDPAYYYNHPIYIFTDKTDKEGK